MGRLWARYARRGRYAASHYSFSISDGKFLHPGDRAIVRDDGFVAPDVIRCLSNRKEFFHE
jgi:hypothetical protein